MANKAKTSNNKANAKAQVQPCHLEHPRSQYFAGFVDVGVRRNRGNQCLDTLEILGLFISGFLFGLSDSQVLFLANCRLCRSASSSTKVFLSRVLNLPIHVRYKGYSLAYYNSTTYRTVGGETT